MPTVINGIGTWYYGKRRIHTRKGTCEFCGSLAELTSYDTTLFFVVFFVPVIPLTRKRILEQCAVCQKHRVLSLEKWEEGKANDGVRVLDDLHNNPNDRDAVVRAIGFAQAYQDEPLFNQVVEPLAGEYKHDAAIQAQLGDAYAYFARWREAEEAYRASLAAQDDELVRQAVGWTLLKQGRPEQAEPFLEHIITNRKREAVGVIYFLIKGYQAEGRHEEALAVMDRRDEAFPDLVDDKEYRKQRQTSMRYRGTQKRIRSSFLDEGRRTGYRHGTWTARLPRWIALVLLVAALGAYLGSAVWIGQARKVFLVNGTNRAYTVVVDGTERALPPRSAIPVRVSEGEVTVAFRDAKLGLQPIRAQIETSFWGRPFAGHTFLINPDRAALIAQEDTWYAQAAPPPGKTQFHFGEPVYHFAGLDYEFQEFPQTVQVKANQPVQKTRVALGPPLSSEAKLNLMLGRVKDQEQVEFCKRLLRLDPGEMFFLYWLQGRLAPEPLLDFLKIHLDDRPVLVEWHRVYQSLMEKAHPETDLRPRYRQIMAEAKGSADAVYLLGRVEPDIDEGEKLFRQAASATPPSGYAMYALAYRAMSEGRFADAVGWLDKAWPLFAEKAIVRPVFHDALLANGNLARLLKELQAEAQLPGMMSVAAYGISRVLAIQGDTARAKAAAADALQLFPAQNRAAFQQALDGMLACCTGDVDGFLKSTVGDGGPPSFEPAFLRGQLKEAATLADQPQSDADVHHALLYLAAIRAKTKDLADAQWQALLAGLAKGGRDERLLGDMLAGRKPLTVRSPQRLLIDPRSKRVYLAVLAQRLPDQAKELSALSRKLDFQRDVISLCLRRVTAEKKQ